jgi:hypothetical protein
MKGYNRRLEKMVLSIKEQNPGLVDATVKELATQHPRVTLEPSSARFGEFSFQPSNGPVPDVFLKYKDEFESFRNVKEAVYA